MGNASRDQNDVPTLLGVSSSDGITPIAVYADPITHRLLIDIPGGAGTVTSVSVVTANGFAGSVADPTTTPAITLSTTASGILKGDGTAMSAGVAGDVDSILPTQTGNNGKFLTTDGTNSSWASVSAGGITIGTTTITSGTDTRILYDNAGVVGEYTLSGSGTVVAMQTSPQLVTPDIGVATGTSLDVSGVLESGANSGTGGQLKMFGATSGDVTLKVAAAAGTATVFQLPATNGSNTNLLQTNGSGVTSWVAIPAASTITVANEASDTTCFPVFVTAATGDLGPKSNAGLTFNSSTASLGATLMTATTSLTTAAVLASSNDSGALGASGTAWSDLFLASGGVINWNAGNATLTHSAGLLTSNVSLSLGTSNVLTTGTIELGNASDTTLSRSAAGVLAVEGVVIPSISSTNTLTNKRVTRRLTTTNAPGATPSTNTDNVDVMNFTGLNTAITSMTTNLSGTPVDGDLVEFRFLDDGTARAITWGASFAATTIALPTTTVISTCLRVLFEWRSASSKWECVATC